MSLLSSASTGISAQDTGVEAEPSAYFEALALHRHWDRGNAADPEAP